jgi:hypothetical protein
MSNKRAAGSGSRQRSREAVSSIELKNGYPHAGSNGINTAVDGSGFTTSVHAGLVTFLRIGAVGRAVRSDVSSRRSSQRRHHH